MPKAFHVVLAKSLYHDPVEEVISMGLFSSPEHADKKSVSFNVFKYKRYVVIPANVPECET